MTHARRLIVVAFAAFITLGLVDGAIGPVWPDLRDEFSRSDAAFGWIFGALSVGYLVASGVSGHLTARLGAGTTILIGAIVNVVGYTALAVSPTFAFVPIGFFLGGLGSGLVDPTVNAWIALRHGGREMGLLHAFYGVGAAVGPLVATVFIAAFDLWRGAYFAVLAVQLAVVASLLVSRDGYELDDENEETRFATPPASAATRFTTIGVLGWSALYVGMEVGYGAWAFTVLTEARDVGEVVAGSLSAAYWGGVMVGRFGLAAIDDRVTPDRIMFGSAVSSLIGGTWFLVDPAGTGGLALPLLGVAFAAMFPVAVASIPVLLGAQRAKLVVGYQFAAAAGGAIVVPALIGIVADQRGPDSAAWVLLVTVVLAAFMWLLVVGLGSRVRSAPDGTHSH